MFGNRRPSWEEDTPPEASVGPTRGREGLAGSPEAHALLRSQGQAGLFSPETRGLATAPDGLRASQGPYTGGATAPLCCPAQKGEAPAPAEPRPLHILPRWPSGARGLSREVGALGLHCPLVPQHLYCQRPTPASPALGPASSGGPRWEWAGEAGGGGDPAVPWAEWSRHPLNEEVCATRSVSTCVEGAWLCISGCVLRGWPR